MRSQKSSQYSTSSRERRHETGAGKLRSSRWLYPQSIRSTKQILVSSGNNTEFQNSSNAATYSWAHCRRTLCSDYGRRTLFDRRNLKPVSKYSSSLCSDLYMNSQGIPQISLVSWYCYSLISPHGYVDIAVLLLLVTPLLPLLDLSWSELVWIFARQITLSNVNYLSATTLWEWNFSMRVMTLAMSIPLTTRQFLLIQNRTIRGS